MQWKADTESGWWLRFVYAMFAPLVFLHLAFFGAFRLSTPIGHYLTLLLLLAAYSGIAALWPLFSSMWIRMPTLILYIGVVSVAAFLYLLAAGCAFYRSCL